jgi:hypothetical protein
MEGEEADLLYLLNQRSRKFIIWEGSLKEDWMPRPEELRELGT